MKEKKQMKNKKCYWEYRVIVRELPCYDTVPSKSFVWASCLIRFQGIEFTQYLSFTQKHKPAHLRWGGVVASGFVIDLGE